MGTGISLTRSNAVARDPRSRYPQVIHGSGIFSGTKIKFRDPSRLNFWDLGALDPSRVSRQGSLSEASEWSKAPFLAMLNLKKAMVLPYMLPLLHEIENLRRRPN